VTAQPVGVRETLAGPSTRDAFVGLCATAFLAYCSYAICRTPLLPLYARDLGAGPAMVGVVMGASTVTGILLKLPAGAWSDILGRRPMLIAGALIFATLPFVYLGVASLAALICVRAVHGSATAIFGPVASASLSDIAPPERRATWLSTYATVQGLGQSLGPVIAGYLVAVRRYDLAFFVAGMLACTTPLLAARWPVRAPATVVVRRSTHFRQAIADVVRDPLILLTSLTQAAQFLLHGALSAFLPLFAHETLGLTPAQLGWIFSVQMVTTLATRPLIGALSDRIGRRSLIVAGLMLCSGAVMAISFAGSATLLTAALLSYAVGVAITSAASAAYITDLSRRTRYGTAHGVFGSIYDVGDAMGPLFGGLLVAAVGYAWMFRAVAAVGLVMALAFLTGSSRAPRIPHPASRTPPVGSAASR
jgi:DHA1 family multidrug resistance protein-like MFS transporter